MCLPAILFGQTSLSSNMENKIRPDADCFADIKETSRQAYERAWNLFKGLNPEFNFEEGIPGEDIFLSFFKYLREEKKAASTSMWTNYSFINTILRNKYSFKLQQLPRVAMYIKGLAVDNKSLPSGRP